MSKDTRVVYGSACTWWDSIDKVAATPFGLPICPYCSCPLFEMQSEKEMREQNKVISDQYGIDYQAAMDWCRGKCSVYLEWDMPSDPAEPPIYIMYQEHLRQAEDSTPS